MRRSPVRRQSARRRRRDAGYPSSRTAVYERAGGLCEVRANWRCERHGHQVHHIAGRSGPDPHRLDNLLLACRPCHELIHAEPSASYENGWMVRRNGATYG